MKILHLSTFDVCGGAAVAAYRTHRGLRRIGIDSRMLVSKKLTDDSSVIETKRSLLFRLKNRLRYRLKINQNLDFSENPKDNKKLLRKIKDINPDIVHLHWICADLLSIEDISKINKPIVWTFHDMWPFTGGCHYSQDCNNYLGSCGVCPRLYSNTKKDLSYHIWRQKIRAWKDLNLTIVAPSRWMMGCVKSSSLFSDKRTELIQYGLDIKAFSPGDRDRAREKFRLSKHKRLILFGAVSATEDKRKGFHLLLSALQKLSKSKWKNKIELAVFGSSQPKNQIELGFKSHYLGHLNDENLLAQLYSAADVMVVPSIQDNLPNTVLEVISCGIPVVAFDIGGMPDMIRHKHNGYLARPFKADDLARGIVWVLENRKRHETLAKNARKRATREFSLGLQAKKHKKLYEEILGG